MNSDVLIVLVAILIGFVSIFTIDILSDVVCRMFPRFDEWLENMSGLEGYDDERA